MSKTRILLVDDHELVRLGLMTLLNDQPNMQVVGEAGTGAEALASVERMQPEIVLMDIRIPGRDGVEVTREISTRFPRSKVIMLTSFADDELVVRAIQAGAAGYVLKQVGNAELLHAISVVADGGSALDPATTARLFARERDKKRQERSDPFQGISERELEVLAEVARGKTNVEIAQALSLSEKTVRNYISAAREKLGVSNRIELALYSTQHNIFERVTQK